MLKRTLLYIAGLLLIGGGVYFTLLEVMRSVRWEGNSPNPWLEIAPGVGFFVTVWHVVPGALGAVLAGFLLLRGARRMSRPKTA